MIFSAILLYLVAGLAGVVPAPGHQWAVILCLIALVLLVARPLYSANPVYGRWL